MSGIVCRSREGELDACWVIWQTYARPLVRLVRASVDLVVYLADSDLARLRVIVGVDHSLHVVDSIVALEAAVRTRSIDVVIIDPQAPGLSDVVALTPLLARYPAVPIIAYSALSGDAVRRTLALAGIGLRHFVLRGYDDQPAAFRAAIERARAHTLTDRLVGALKPALARIPSPLAAAIQLVFHAPHRARNALALARLAGIPARTCSEALARAGLASTRSFVCAAHVLHTYHHLRGGDDRVTDIARRLGYRAPHALVANSRRMTGYRPTELAHRVAPDALVSQLAKRLTTRNPLPGRPRRARRPGAANPAPL